MRAMERYEVEYCADGVFAARYATCRQHWGGRRDISRGLSVSVFNHSGMEDNKGFPLGLRV